MGKTLATSPQVFYVSEPFNPTNHHGVCALRPPQWYFYVCEENQASHEHALDDMIALSYNVPGKLADAPNLRGLRQLASELSGFARARAKHQRVLMKDPIALFSAPWLAHRYDMNVVVMIRHPAAFVSSLKRYDLHFDFHNFLDQPYLMRDYLAPFAEEIERGAKNGAGLIDQGALLWKVIHGVIDRFRTEHPDWTFERHEDLSLRPEQCYQRLFEAFDLEFTDEVRAWVQKSSSSEGDCEVVAYDELVRNSAVNMVSWKQRLSPDEIARIRELVEPVSAQFYFDHEW